MQQAQDGLPQPSASSGSSRTNTLLAMPYFQALLSNLQVRYSSIKSVLNILCSPVVVVLISAILFSFSFSFLLFCFLHCCCISCCCFSVKIFIFIFQGVLMLSKAYKSAMVVYFPFTSGIFVLFYVHAIFFRGKPSLFLSTRLC